MKIDDEMQVEGCEVRGNFWLSEEIIQAAILRSAPDKDWHSVEQTLRGVPFKEWKDYLKAS